jgi:hypothetical protein
MVFCPFDHVWKDDLGSEFFFSFVRKFAKKDRRSFMSLASSPFMAKLSWRTLLIRLYDYALIVFFV